MKKWVFGLLLLAAYFFDLTLGKNLAFFSESVNLVLVFAVLGVFLFKQGWAMIFSGLAGFLLYVQQPNIFPSDCLILPVIVYLLCRLANKISFELPWMKVVAVALAAFVYQVFRFALSAYYGQMIPLGVVLKTFFIATLYPALIFWLLIKYFSFKWAE